MSPGSTPRSPRTPEEQAAREGARILQRMSQSGTISSPSRAPRPSPSAIPPQAIDTPLESDSEEEEAKQRFELYRVGHRARTYTSPSGTRPSGAVYSEATGRLSVPVARYEHPGGEGDDESDEERYEDSSGSLAPSNTGYVDTPPWTVGDPVRQPLLYDVPAAGGLVEQRRISFMVDFDDPVDVAKANKARRLAVWREKSKLGMAMLRPSTQDRAYDQTRDDAIASIIDSYAALHNGALASYKQIHAEYNQLYPAENRATASISSHISKMPQLRTARARYERRH